MKATADSGIKEASAAAAVKGQMEPTPRPWRVSSFNNTEIVADVRGGAIVADTFNGIITDQKECPANAELICRAVNNFDALVEALKQARMQLLFSRTTRNSLPRSERMAWMDEIAALIVSAENGQSVPSGNDSSSASSSPKSAAVTPTKGTN